MENAYELGRREIDLIHLREELVGHRGLNMKMTYIGVLNRSRREVYSPTDRF
jgi:hypothetical protein